MPRQVTGVALREEKSPPTCATVLPLDQESAAQVKSIKSGHKSPPFPIASCLPDRLKKTPQ